MTRKIAVSDLLARRAVAAQTRKNMAFALAVKWWLAERWTKKRATKPAIAKEELRPIIV